MDTLLFIGRCWVTIKMKTKVLLTIIIIYLFQVINLYGKQLTIDSSNILQYLFNDTAQTYENYPTLNKTDFISLNYENASRSFIWAPSLYVNDLGTPGRLSTLSYRGGSIRETGFSLNGIPLISPLYESQNVNILPVALINKIRIYSSENPFFSIQSQPSQIAVSSPSFFENTPYTEITYRVGDYARKFVDVFFQRKVTSRTGIGIVADFNSFPGEYSDQNFDGKHFWITVNHKINKKWSTNFWSLISKQGINDNVEYAAFPIVSRQGPFISWSDGTFRFNDDRSLYAVQIHRDSVASLWKFKLDMFGSRSRHTINNTVSTQKTGQHENYDGGMVSLERRIPKGYLYVTGSEIYYRIRQFDQKDLSKSLVGISFGIERRITERNNFYFRNGIQNDGVRGSLFTWSGNWDSKLTKTISGIAKLGQFERFISYQERFFYEYEFFGSPKKLKPVRYTEGEIGFKFQRNKLLTGMVTVFQRNISHDYNLFTNHFFNQRTSDFTSGTNRIVRGTEFSTSVHVSSIMQLSGTITAHNVSKSSGFEWVPSYYGGVGLTFTDLHRWWLPYDVHTKIHLIMRYFGQNNQLTFLPQVMEFAQLPVLIHSTQLLDIKGSLSIKSFEVFYEVDNVFGTAYEPVLNYRIPVRTIRIGIRWKFLN